MYYVLIVLGPWGYLVVCTPTLCLVSSTEIYNSWAQTYLALIGQALSNCALIGSSGVSSCVDVQTETQLARHVPSHPTYRQNHSEMQLKSAV